MTSRAHRRTSGAPIHLDGSQRAFADSVERHRSLFEYNPHAAFSVDLQGYFVDANPVALRMSGYSLPELRKLRFDALICPEHVQRTVDAFQDAIDRIPQQLQASMLHREGHRIEMSLTAMPVVVSNEVVGVHGVAEDITESNELRRELERTRRLAEEASATKSLFLANMSHEVRTPLTSLLGSVEVLMETELDEDQSVLVQLIDRSGERLLQLVGDLLDFSRMEAGTFALNETAVDVRALVEETATYAAKLAHRRGLDLGWHVADDVPHQVRADALRLSQVISNLLENAVKFTEVGRVSLTLDVVRDPGTDPRLRVRVEDTGIGIGEDQLPTLFHPFTQADPSATRKYGGAGLGLAISQEITSLMGGSLTVDSTVGVGSTFSATVPLRLLLD